MERINREYYLENKTAKNVVMYLDTLHAMIMSSKINKVKIGCNLEGTREPRCSKKMPIKKRRENPGT
jgi:hypothetical protein